MNTGYIIWMYRHLKKSIQHDRYIIIRYFGTICIFGLPFAILGHLFNNKTLYALAVLSCLIGMLYWFTHDIYKNSINKGE